MKGRLFIFRLLWSSPFRRLPPRTGRGISSILVAASLAWVACDGSPVEPVEEDTIGTAGGELSSPGVTLTVPAGALSSATRISIAPADAGEIPSEVGFPADSLVSGTLHEFGPEGLSFGTAATLTLSYDSDLLPPGTDESRLRVARIDSVYSLVPVSTRDTLNDRISVQVDHFTLFGVLVPRLVPDFTARISVEETVGVSDVVDASAPGVVQISVDERIGLSESLQSPEVGQPSMPLAVDETVSVADVVLLEAPGVVGIEITETVGVSDTPTASVLGGASAAVEEGVAIADAVDIQVTPAATLYVGSGLGTLGVFDTDLTPVGSVDIPGQVGYVARRPGSDEVWVAERGTDSLVVVDANTNARVAAEYSGTLDPFVIAFDDAGSIAVVGDNDAERLTIFDAAALTQQGLTLRNFGVPRVTAVQLSGDGSTAWVAGTNVAKVDVPGRTPLDTAAVGGITYASDLALTADESEVWVMDGLSGNVVVYDAVGLAVLDTIPLSAGTTTGGEHLIISEDGATAFATTASLGELVVIDVATRSERTRYSIGGSASWVAHDPDRDLVYLTSIQPDDELIVFDLATGAVVDRITFTSPRGLILFR